MTADEVTLYAYVLMPNHFHLLVQTPLGNIKKFMQRLNTAYSMYYRYKHNKPGHCFQGRYGARIVKDDDYIIRLTRYIHLNPVKTKSMEKQDSPKRLEYLLSYPWSSLHGYLHKHASQNFIDYRWLKLMHRNSMSHNREEYARYIEQTLVANDQLLINGFSASRYAIGDEEFIKESEAELKQMHLEKVCGSSDIYLPKKHVIQINDIIDKVAEIYEIKSSDIFDHGHLAGEAKTIAIELCCKLTGESQRAVGNHFGYSHDSSIAKQRKMFRDKTSINMKHKRKINKLIKDFTADIQ